MTAIQFEQVWNALYTSVPPISYLLKEAYPKRWLRIHSLPESKRYPENDSDWNVLLNRQNTLITDLVGIDSHILLVTGNYDCNSGNNHSWHFSSVDSMRHFSFTELKPISLDIINEGFGPDDVYRPFFAQIHWRPSALDNVLKDIAQDMVRVFFVSLANQCIIAPYDGGVDIIMKDVYTRDNYKARYRRWLSTREDGL